MIEKDWLEQRYTRDVASIADIAEEAGCSIHNIKRLLQKWQVKREPGKTRIVAWNKGLTKETNDSLKRLAESRLGEGNPMHGRPAWNTGLTKETSEILAENGRKLAGIPISDEAKKKMSLEKTGLRGEEANNFKRGFHENVHGYLVVSDGKVKDYLHRVVAKNYLGRDLEPGEHVHHLDGDKTNNEPSNLIVLSRSAHTKLHRYCSVDDVEGQKNWLAQNDIDYLVLNEG